MKTRKNSKLIIDKGLSILRKVFLRKKTESLSYLWLGLEKIADSSYEIFLKSFDFGESNFGDSTKFEAHIAALFYIDYALVGEKISHDVRGNFYILGKNKIIEKFGDKIVDTNLSEIVDYRYYDQYSQILVKGEQNWLQSFHNLYEINLKGTENKNAVKKLPGIRKEGDVEWMPKKMMFIKDEIANVYKAVKLAKELPSGKNL